MKNGKKTSMEEMHSDDALVEQIRIGDEKAAEELIKRYYTSIWSFELNLF